MIETTMPNRYRFHEALPKHKAELVDGRLILGGSLHKSAMALAFMVQELGAEAVAAIVPQEVLKDAVIEVFGRSDGPGPLADFGVVEPHNRIHKLATDLRMGLSLQGVNAWGGTMAVKLGTDVFMPDIYVYRPENQHRQRDLYFDGAPDFIMEVVSPNMRTFDFGTRLQRYAAAGVPEVWMIDFEQRHFRPFCLKNSTYEAVPVESAGFASATMPGFFIQHERIFESTERLGMFPLDIFTVPDSLIKQPQKNGAAAEQPCPFVPRLAPDPVSIRFEEFIHWGGEVKFELIDGKPLFGGSDQTTQEWLVLLLMTLGVKEAIHYLPQDDWAKIIQ